MLYITNKKSLVVCRPERDYDEAVFDSLARFFWRNSALFFLMPSPASFFSVHCLEGGQDSKQSDCDEKTINKDLLDRLSLYKCGRHYVMSLLLLGESRYTLQPSVFNLIKFLINTTKAVKANKWSDGEGEITVAYIARAREGRVQSCKKDVETVKILIDLKRRINFSGSFNIAYTRVKPEKISSASFLPRERTKKTKSPKVFR